MKGSWNPVGIVVLAFLLLLVVVAVLSLVQAIATDGLSLQSIQSSSNPAWAVCCCSSVGALAVIAGLIYGATANLENGDGDR